MSKDGDLRLFVVLHIDPSHHTCNVEPTKIAKSILIRHNLTWSLFIHGKPVTNSPVLTSIPEVLKPDSFTELLDIVHKSSVCNRNADEKYVKMCQEKKGGLRSLKGDTVAYLHEGYPYSLPDKGTVVYATIRHKSCQLLIDDHLHQCSTCCNYQPVIRSVYSNFSKHLHDSTPTSKTNVRYMRTPQRAKYITSLKNAIKCYKTQVKRLNLKLEKETARVGVDVDEDIHSDVVQSAVGSYQVEVDKMKTDDFRKFFWNHQVHCIMICMSGK